MQTYRHYIFQVIFSIVRHEEDAKDVTQEVRFRKRDENILNADELRKIASDY